MERKKHKRLTDNIMKPEDLKKSRMHVGGNVSGPSTSASSSGGIKAKLDFRSTAPIAAKQNPHQNATAGPSVQSSHTVRPVLDEKWKEFGDTINLNIDTFAKSIKESVESDKFNKVARMMVAALKSFSSGDMLKVEYRLMGTMAETIKNHGTKLNHVPLHRGLLFVISHSRSYPENILQLFISMVTSLAKQQPMLDKCYVEAYLHDAVGMNVGLGTANRCAWIDKPFSEALVKLILGPFATIYPDPEMYATCQIENFSISEYLPKERLGHRVREEQLSVFLEFLKPWFDTIRGELLPRTLFRALCLLCGYDQVRLFIAGRLEVWITLQKFHREISELLLVLGCNIDAKRAHDEEVIDILLKLNSKNMKTRTVAGPYTAAIKKISEKLENTHCVFQTLIQNETGPPQNRSPTNLPTMIMLLSCQPIETAKAMALVCARELIREGENSAMMLRQFMSSFVINAYRISRAEFPFSVFTATFLDVILEEGEAAEICRLAVDIVVQVPLATLAALLSTRESAFAAKYSNLIASGSVAMIPPEARLARETFQSEFVLYCEAVIEWLIKARSLFAEENDYIRCFSLLLFLEKKRELYTSIEGAAVSDTEIVTYIHMFGECGISEKMFLLLFEEKSGALSPRIIIELASALTQRAALYHSNFQEAPLVKLTDPFALIDGLLSRTVLPESELPRFEDLPLLCSRELFWIAWNCIILWIAGGEIVPCFEKIYVSYPILRYIIFCIMTERFDFPLTFEGKTADEMQEQEEAVAATEEKVFEIYEKKLMRPLNSLSAYASIFPDKKTFRAPLLLDDIQVFADRFKLASRFSRCTSPPLLSQLVSSIGAQSSLFAVREMLKADPSTASMLTAECTFHALMYYFDSQRMRDIDQPANLAIRALIRQAESNFKSVEPVEQDFLLQSFIHSLASPNISIRAAVVNAFAKLFPSSEDKPFDLFKLSKVPRFESGKLKYLETLASALLVEPDIALANSYLQFLTQNSSDKEHIHTLARAVCDTLSVDCHPLHNSLCEYFNQYVDMCVENHQVQDAKSLNEMLCCFEFGPYRVAISREVPKAVIKLLSKYATNGTNDTSFESLVELWLSPGSIPKIVDPETGLGTQFLSLPMRKEMLKSAEQRVVDAALDELSEKDAQEFVLVSQMSMETAEKVIRKAEDMKVEDICRSELSSMYLLVRGYRIKGIKAGAQLETRLKAQLDRQDMFVEKEEPMEVMEEGEHVQAPLPFLDKEDGERTLTDMDTLTIPTTDITAWLKVNCAVSTPTKQREPPAFRLPTAFIQSAMTDEKSALACLQHIEANLKFFLFHENAFQTLIVTVDAAANKFEFVKKRLENLAVRLLKSVSPPASVAGVLQKHASNSRGVHQRTPMAPVKTSTFAEFAVAVKGVSIDQEKQIVDEFMANFVEDKGEVIESDDVLAFVRSIRSVYSGANAEVTAEKCLSNRWSAHLQRIVCSALLDDFRDTACSVFVFRIVASYVRKYPLASYSELFLVRDKSDRFVINKKVFQTLVIFFSDLATKNDEYEARAINLMVVIEKQGSTQAGFQFGRALLQTSCASPKSSYRNVAKKLLAAVATRLAYLSYTNGIASSMRVLTNVETRDSCIRRCEQIIDRIVELPMDPKLALSEDICEEERVTKETKEAKEDSSKVVRPGSKRPAERGGRGGPPAKSGRFITPNELPNPMGAGGAAAGAGAAGSSGGGSQPVPNEEAPSEENPQKREWIATSHAMSRFVSLLREHPNVVKMKFPVLAHFISRLAAMNNKELREDNRLRKFEMIVQAVIILCPTMDSEEICSVDTALTNSLEFYEKHIDGGVFGIKTQTAYAELIIRACASYLNRSFVEARTFLRDNRPSVERVCKRCIDMYNADLVLDNCESATAVVAV
ncbi:unnamed protein product [Caenorhabditis sp. 36 PRJEB53466]|nr:unnamed protein product [Caenorhabditis sp. 36 PRJEB53466]